MIDWTQTNHVWTVESPVIAAQVGTITEGMALVRAFEGGIIKVKASTGATTDRVEGVCMMPRRVVSSLNTKIVQVTAPIGGGTVLLPNLVSGSIGAYNATTNAQVTVSAGAASGSNIQSTTDATTGLTALTFDSTGAGNAGGAFNVCFAYAMSTFESQALFGNPSPGLFASDVLNQTGVFKIGRVFVNNFSTTANWYAGSGIPTVGVITGGVWTDATSASGVGVVPPNVDIIQLPTAAYPYLGLEIH